MLHFFCCVYAVRLCIQEDAIFKIHVDKAQSCFHVRSTYRSVPAESSSRLLCRARSRHYMACSSMWRQSRRLYRSRVDLEYGENLSDMILAVGRSFEHKFRCARGPAGVGGSQDVRRGTLPEPKHANAMIEEHVERGTGGTSNQSVQVKMFKYLPGSEHPGNARPGSWIGWETPVRPFPVTSSRFETAGRRREV